MSGDANALYELRTEVATLRSRVAMLSAEARANYVLFNHAVNSRNSIVSVGRMCSVLLRDDLTIVSTANTEAILGHIELGHPITEALAGSAVRDYFNAIHALGTQLSAAAGSVVRERWTPVFPAPGSHAPAFEDWVSVPPGTWESDPSTARLVRDAVPGSEHYLVSPGELIGPNDDFRIEYTARADGPPRDLSLVVGAGIVPGVAGVHGARPDNDGYSFAFGAMENQSTELQRRLETICENENVRIEPGRDHHCVAERVGGQLRFMVDGREAFCTVDCLPLMGQGYGCVGLYTCAPAHVFRDLSVLTRATCILPQTLEQIKRLRGAVLELQKCPARSVEVHYMGKNLFVLRDVSAGQGRPG